ncbi:hypothetical protein TSO221_25130 [Azospirillum sp. TSO22-1]|nr:hypothetical protein TSO221_25130 [Azospirillum sp. TSO22-1]
MLLVEDGRCTEANPALFRLTGFEPGEIIGRPWTKLLAPRHRADAARCFDAAAPVVTEVRRKGGGAFVAEIESRRRAAPDGAVVHALAVRDVTHRRDAERAMADAVADLAAVLDAMRNAVVTMDGAGVVRSFNRAAEEAFGYRADEVVGGPVTRLMPADAGATHQGYVDRYLSSGVGTVIGRGREVVARRKNGTTFPAHLAVAEMPPRIDGTRRFVGTLIDITDMKRTEHTLIEARLAAEAADRAKTRFLSTLSHELRTPLNAINGFSQLLEMAFERGGVDEKHLHYARAIHQNGNALLRMLDDMMEYALLDLGRKTIDVAEVALDEVVETVLAMLDRRAREKRIALRVGLHDRDDRLSGERGALIQILFCLLDNAVKFTPPDGTVALTTRRRREGLVEIEVADTGMGIAPDKLDRLFIPFHGTEPLLASEHGGLGIGLAIAKRLVDLHGGAIRVASTPGSGSAFIVTLPVWI